MADKIQRIRPYFDKEIGWVFDDPKFGIVKELLTDGIDTILDIVSAKHKFNKYAGFDVYFSDSEIHDFDLSFVKTSSIDIDQESEGVVYLCVEYDMIGWLCPVLFRYFDAAPKTIYIKLSNLCGELKREANKRGFDIIDASNSTIEIHEYDSKAVKLKMVDKLLSSNTDGRFYIRYLAPMHVQLSDWVSEISNKNYATDDVRSKIHITTKDENCSKFIVFENFS